MIKLSQKDLRLRAAQRAANNAFEAHVQSAGYEHIDKMCLEKVFEKLFQNQSQDHLESILTKKRLLRKPILRKIEERLEKHFFDERFKKSCRDFNYKFDETQTKEEIKKEKLEFLFGREKKTHFEVDYDYFRDNKIQAPNFAERAYYSTSKKYAAISHLLIPYKKIKEYRAYVASEEKRRKKIEEQHATSIALAKVFRNFLIKNNINYFYSRATYTNTIYIDVFDQKYRFSDHAKGKNHMRFNSYTGERERVCYDQAQTWVKSLRFLKQIQNKILKQNAE